MTAARANLINALTLIFMSGWGYLAASKPSPTALIPLAVGVVLLLFWSGVRSENKIIAHLAVLLTVLIALALVVPLRSALASGDALGVVRVGLMIATSIFATVFFVRSFSAARRRARTHTS